MSRLSLGVLGGEISYSLSPRIFDWAFRETGIAGDYRVFDLPPGEARRFLLEQREWDGLNVTTPYKPLAYECCQNLSAEAQATQAVNTIQRGPEGLTGYDSDEAGFKYALEAVAGSDFQFRSALVIGSGGAARAVAFSLSRTHPDARVEVTSRNWPQARLRMEALGRTFASYSCIEVETASHFLRDFDLVVQATPVGSVKRPGCPLIEPLIFKPGAVVMDLIYAPRVTPFLKYAEASGARVQNGLPMLVAQAAESFRIWTGRTFPLEAAMKYLLPDLAAA